MASAKQEAHAESVGAEDADTWMAETPDRDAWSAAIEPGVLGADEALINALGVNAALKLLGCDDPKDQSNLLGAYSRGWANRVLEALTD